MGSGQSPRSSVGLLEAVEQAAKRDGGRLFKGWSPLRVFVTFHIAALAACAGLVVAFLHYDANSPEGPLFSLFLAVIVAFLGVTGWMSWKSHREAGR